MKMHLTGSTEDLIMPRMEEEIHICSNLSQPSGPRGRARGRAHGREACGGLLPGLSTQHMVSGLDCNDCVLAST